MNQHFLSFVFTGSTHALHCPARGTQGAPQCPEVGVTDRVPNSLFAMAVLHEPSRSSLHRGSPQRPSPPNALLALPGGPGWRRSPRCHVLCWHQRQSRGQCWGATGAEAAAVGRGLVQESQQP